MGTHGVMILIGWNHFQGEEMILWSYYKICLGDGDTVYMDVQANVPIVKLERKYALKF